MPHISNKYHLLALGLVLALAAFFRFWAAPLSTGPDVSQFWAFAKVFQLHGLDFYRYADGTAAIFPFKGWGFVYPPLWLLISRLALVAAPTSSATNIMVDSSWRLAMKTPIIAADLAIGCLLYWAVPGSKSRKLLFASLWLFHPTSWYESAVFGQFDAVAAALLLASIILLARNRDWLAFLLAGLAVMTKQHTLIPIALMVASQTQYRSERIFTLVLALFPAVWLWLFDVSFWFNYLHPTSPWVTAILARIGLTHPALPDYAYVSFALVLMTLSLAYVVCVFLRWRNPKEGTKPLPPVSVGSVSHPPTQER